MKNRIEQVEPKKKHPGGRPSKYQDTFPKSILDFFSRPLYHKEIVSVIHFKNGGSEDKYGFIPNDPPFFSDWCWDIAKITEPTMCEWVKEDSPHFHEEFFKAYNRCKDLQKEFLIKNCLAQRTNAPMSIFTLKNVSDMRDEQYLKGEGFGKTEYHYTINKTYLSDKEKEAEPNRIEEQLRVNS